MTLSFFYGVVEAMGKEYRNPDVDEIAVAAIVIQKAYSSCHASFVTSACVTGMGCRTVHG